MNYPPKTYDDIITFTGKVVIQHLKEIVEAESNNPEWPTYPEELSNIARGLPLFIGCLFVVILEQQYKIKISI